MQVGAQIFLESASNVKRGRPQDQAIDHAILKAALHLVSAKGFRAITVDQIAAKAGVGKMTLYRRWPNKSSLVMDALLKLVGPQTEFPTTQHALDSLRQQLRLQAAFFRSKYGQLIRSLVAEAQADDELARAFRDGWLVPRRVGVRRVLEKAAQDGELRQDIDLDTAIDMLYGPIYYRLLLGTGEIDERFTDEIFERFLVGHEARKAKTDGEGQRDADRSG